MAPKTTTQAGPTPHSVRARMLGLLGRLHIARGDFELSLGALQDRLSICETIKDWDGFVGTLIWIGHAYRLLNDTPRASDQYRKALTISRQYKLRHRIGESLNHIAMTYYYDKQMEKALEYFTASVAELQDNGASALLGQTLMHIGNIHRKAEENKKADKYLADAVKVLKGVGDEYNLGMALANRALLSFSQDENATGKTQMKEAFERLRFAGAQSEIHLFMATLETVFGIKKLN